MAEPDQRGWAVYAHLSGTDLRIYTYSVYGVTDAAEAVQIIEQLGIVGIPSKLFRLEAIATFKPPASSAA